MVPLGVGLVGGVLERGPVTFVPLGVPSDGSGGLNRGVFLKVRRVVVGGLGCCCCRCWEPLGCHVSIRGRVYRSNLCWSRLRYFSDMGAAAGADNRGWSGVCG